MPSSRISPRLPPANVCPLMRCDQVKMPYEAPRKKTPRVRTKCKKTETRVKVGGVMLSPGQKMTVRRAMHARCNTMRAVHQARRVEWMVAAYWLALEGSSQELFERMKTSCCNSPLVNILMTRTRSTNPLQRISLLGRDNRRTRHPRRLLLCVPSLRQLRPRSPRRVQPARI